jgi:hypothetical protein
MCICKCIYIFTWINQNTFRISHVKYGTDRDNDFNEISPKTVDKNTDVDVDNEDKNHITENHENGLNTVLDPASNQDELSSR